MNPPLAVGQSPTEPLTGSNRSLRSVADCDVLMMLAPHSASSSLWAFPLHWKLLLLSRSQKPEVAR